MRYIQGNVIFHSTQAIFDEGYFSKCPNSHSREKTPSRGLTPEIKSSAPRPFGEDEPAPIPSPPVLSYPRLLTPPIPPNLPTHSESPSPSPLLVPPEQPLVKVEEVEYNQDNDTEMLSPSLPSPPKAGPLHPQPEENATPQRYSLRRSTHETRTPHREGNIYGEDYHPTDILRRYYARIENSFKKAVQEEI